MSEFKFACPVCGQHLTADSAAGGSQLECPTCFQKIIVPQPPDSESKFILSASQANRHRPRAMEGLADLGPIRRKRSAGVLPLVGLVLVLLGAAAAGYWLFREKFRPRPFVPAEPATNITAVLPPVAAR